MIERPEPAPTHMAVAIVPFQVKLVWNAILAKRCGHHTIIYF